MNQPTSSLFAADATCEKTDGLNRFDSLPLPTTSSDDGSLGAFNESVARVPLKPFYDDGKGIVIFCGDCRDVLPMLGKFDLLLTDPPYGHGDRWQGGTWGAAEMYKDAMKWDAETPSDETMDAVIAAADVGIVWGGNYFRLPPSRCWLSWEKSSRMNTLADFELAWTSMDRPSKAKREDRNPDGKRVHPTQKPLSVIRWCCGFVPDAKSVLDPFMGSGTTLVAAKLLGLRAVGIEINREYCEAAVRRLSQKVFDFNE